MSDASGSKLRKRVETVLFMCVVSAVFTSGVSLAYLATRERVRINETVFLKRALLGCAGVDVPADARDVAAAYRSCIEEVLDETGTAGCYVARLPGSEQPTGYVCIERGAGLWGSIVAVVGFEPDLKTLIGIDFIQQNETPGLGGRIVEDWFRNQFVGKRGPFTMAPEGEADGIDEFDAITGATITSTAVKDILNRSAERIAEMVSEGQDG
jgi:Na+-transporting NADH:ubiquinone oxidoreductase subunit C